MGRGLLAQLSWPSECCLGTDPPTQADNPILRNPLIDLCLLCSLPRTFWSLFQSISQKPCTSVFKSYLQSKWQEDRKRVKKKRKKVEGRRVSQLPLRTAAPLNEKWAPPALGTWAPAVFCGGCLGRHCPSHRTAWAWGKKYTQQKETEEHQGDSLGLLFLRVLFSASSQN